MKSLVLFFLAALPFAASAADRPNILMIAVDDLRPQLGCYGQEQIHSPNLDRLASQGTLFQRAYCMVPTCGASRASLMTSIRPAPKRFVTHLAYAEKDAPGITTLNTHLKENGYHTISNGKIFHHPEDSAIGWTEPAWRPSPGKPSTIAPEDRRQKKAANAPDKSEGKGKGKVKDKGAAKNSKPERGSPYEISPLEDHQLSDGMVAEKTIKDLRRLKDQDHPFFIAAGFFKPHLPFIAPKKYWDLYPEDSIKLPANYHTPKDAPAESIHNSGELRSYQGVPKTGPLPEDMALNMIRGYQACVSFTDAQIGKILEELDRLGLAENTIVILWGDHGWNLGEHTLWCKHSCYETSLQVPLIIRAPGFKGDVKTAGLTELIDVYPTLCELAGLPIPAHVQGRSFVPLMNTPDMEWKDQAVSRFMAGDTIRTNEHRFTEYSNSQGQPTARMLYDHTTDPAENLNLSEQPAQAETVEQLTARLRSAKGKNGDLPVKKQ